MQHYQNAVKYPCKGCSGLGFKIFITAIENRLGHLNIPVAERTPYKLINTVCRIGKAEIVQVLGQVVRCLFYFGNNPFVDRVFDGINIKIVRQYALVHLAKTCGIPQFGSKVAIALNTRFRNVNVTTLGFHCSHKET